MIHHLIKQRRSTVLFSPEEIDSTVVDRLWEAARWAPSSLNQQPWRFVYVNKGDKNYEQVLSCLMEKNQEWAKNAPMLVVTIAQVISDYKDRENIYAWHDTAMAYSNMVFQAEHEGLSVHPMGGFKRDQLRRVIQIPERFEPVIVVAIGYKTDTGNFSEELISREDSERKRNMKEIFVFRNSFME